MDVKLRLQISIALLGTFLGLLLSPTAMAFQCRSVLIRAPEPTTELVEKTLNELAQMKLLLDMAVAQGTSDIQITMLKSLYPQRETAFLEILKSHNLMTPEQAKQKIREAIARAQGRHSEEGKKDQEQRVVEQESIKDILVMEGSLKMHPIEPTNLIEKKFWMSTTLITQRQWAIIASLFPGEMNENPSVHTNNKNSQVVALPDGKELEMQPENPVEYVTAVKDKEDRDYYSSAYNFIEKINILSQKNDPTIYQLIAGHQKGMIYDLPSEHQYEQVATDFGNSKGPNAGKLYQYAHIQSNYGTGTIPVASLKPFEVTGGKFFDLIGNVGSLTSTTRKDQVVVKGGSYTSDNKIKFSSRSLVEPSAQSEHVGFRIIGFLP